MMVSVSLFILLVIRYITEDRVLEGLMYEAMARNLSLGLGSLWAPFYSVTTQSQFQQFFPLGIIVESLFFTVLGDHQTIGIIWGMCLCGLTVWGMVSLWHVLYEKQGGFQYSWLPLCFWILCPTITWAFVNNMLENQMLMFIIWSSVFYLLLLIRKFYWKWFLGANLCLLFAVFSKSFSAFMFLCLPILFSISYIQNFQRAWNIFKYSAIFQFTSIALLYFSSSHIQSYFKNYYYHHFGRGFLFKKWFQSEKFYIYIDLFLDIVPALLLFLVLFGLQRSLSKKEVFSWEYSQHHGLFFGLCGVISLIPNLVGVYHFSDTFIVCCTFFSFSFASYILPLVISKVEYYKMSRSKMISYGALWVFFHLIILGAVSLYMNPNRRGFISDISKISQHLSKEHTVVGSSSSILGDSFLVANFIRSGGISLDSHIGNYDFFISFRQEDPLPNYQKVILDLKWFSLYEKKEIFTKRDLIEPSQQ